MTSRETNHYKLRRLQPSPAVELKVHYKHNVGNLAWNAPFNEIGYILSAGHSCGWPSLRSASTFPSWLFACSSSEAALSHCRRLRQRHSTRFHSSLCTRSTCRGRYDPAVHTSSLLTVLHNTRDGARYIQNKKEMVLWPDSNSFHLTDPLSRHSCSPHSNSVMAHSMLASQNLITSRESPLVHVYHVWSTSINAFVSYHAHGVTDRQTDRQYQPIT